jgi:hypothetical protein
MKKVEIRIAVNSINESKIFYCDDLDLFVFKYDYGMTTISLSYKNNPDFILKLTETLFKPNERPLFGLWIENCGKTFQELQEKKFKSSGELISKEVFEYPIGKNFLLRDPSNNKFLIFEENFTNP